MPPTVQQLTQQLPWILMIATPPALLAGGILSGRLGWFRLRAPAGLREPPLWGLLAVLGTAACWFLGNIAGSALAHSMGVAAAPAGTTREAFIANACAAAFSAAFILSYVRRRLGQPSSTLGLVGTDVRNLAPVVLLYPLTFLPLGAISAVWQLLLYVGLGVEPGESDQDAVRLFKTETLAGHFDGVVLLLLLGVVIAPLSEELFFRGLVFGWLRTQWGALAAAVTTSAVFSAVHFALAPLVPLFLLGLLLTYIYHRTQCLYLSMLFHALFNAGTFALLLAKLG